MEKEAESDIMKDLISQADAARLRRVSRASINELIKRGRLNSVKVAGKALLRRSEVVSFREEKRGPKTGNEN